MCNSKVTYNGNGHYFFDEREEIEMKLVSVKEMKTIEAAANKHGVSYSQMMRLAGQGMAEVILSQWGNLQEPGVLGLVGAGNNGGDTLVALTALQRAGWHAKAYLTHLRGSGDALLGAFLDAGGQVLLAVEDSAYAGLDIWLEESTVLLDGISGTGFRLPLTAELTGLLVHIAAQARSIHVVAVDCPSGVDCESGEMSPAVLPAEITVCMAAVKTGLLRFPAYGRVGRLEVVNIGLPEDLAEWQAVQGEVIGAERVSALLPRRGVGGHKGSFGALLAVGGSINYSGAIALASRAAYRMGCGLVRVATIAPLHAAIAGALLEVTWLLLPHEMGVIAADAAEVVVENLSKVDALLLGPGMGQENTTADFFNRLIMGKGGSSALPPLVVDADGLRLLAALPGWKHLIHKPAVLTPHPGEMAALTGLTVEMIQADRHSVARKAAAEWGQVVILKGALTVVAAPDGRWGIIPVATSALAKAGTGDVLAGMVAALRAQGVGAYEAAVCAAWMHAQAGLVAECEVGHAAGVLASDVIRAIPEVFQQLSSL